MYVLNNHAFFTDGGQASVELWRMRMPDGEPSSWPRFPMVALPMRFRGRQARGLCLQHSAVGPGRCHRLDTSQVDPTRRRHDLESRCWPSGDLDHRFEVLQPESSRDRRGWAQRLVCTVSRTEPDVWVAENFDPEGRR